MTLAVIATGLNAPTKAKHFESIDQQTGCKPFMHLYVEAGDQAPRLGAMENFYRAVHTLYPDDIVVMVDGDDWLAHPRVLAKVEAMHEAGAWVTYGSYVFADGVAGHMRAYPSPDYRGLPWLATHLKTFRASLFQRLPRESFQIDGQWLEHARDLATMFPVMELAGPSRCTFCPEVLYIYNRASSFEFNASATELFAEQKQVRHVRTMRPYEALP
jgi:hypothetical protein